MGSAGESVGYLRFRFGTSKDLNRELCLKRWIFKSLNSTRNRVRSFTPSISWISNVDLNLRNISGHIADNSYSFPSVNDFLSYVIMEI